jgi:hypothetical protein
MDHSVVGIDKKNEIDRVKVIIKIDWGRKSQNCESGFGICSVSVEVDLGIDLSNISFRGGADANGKLQLDITTRGMESIRKQFGSDVIILEEDFRLSDEMCKTLELRLGYTIKAGRYRPVKTTTGEYTVVL